MSVEWNTPIKDINQQTELIHWGISKNIKPRKNHKYIKREWKNGRWRYYYDLNELKNTTENVINNVAESVQNLQNKFSKNTKIVVTRGKQWLNNFENRNVSTTLITSLNLKHDEFTSEQDQTLVNPKYNPEKYEYSNNCTYCTAAYDLRRRGYDVEASGMTDTVLPNHTIVTSWYKNTTVLSGKYHGKIMTNSGKKLLSNTKETFNNMPSGSYGHFSVQWETGGGHSMIWEKQEGATIIRDCQNNKTYTYMQWARANENLVSSTYILRTDNREPNDNILVAVRNRKK